MSITYNPKQKTRVRKLGFLSSNSTIAGRKRLSNRRTKGRAKLCVSKYKKK